MKVCREHHSRGESVDEIAKALGDVLTFVIVAAATHDADAENAADRVAEYLTENIRTDYGKYHAGTATEKRGISCH